MNGLYDDLRHALRSIAKSPGFSAVVVLTLALGIGANTAIFTLFDQVALRRLPVANPDELVVLDGPGPFQGRTENDHTFSVPMFRDLREGNTVFSGLFARYPTSLTLIADGGAERVAGELVSGEYFEVLGLRPAAGRLFGPADDVTPGAHPVAVVGHGYWRRRFGGDPEVVGRRIAVNGHPLTVVGVAPEGFSGTDLGAPPDVFVPLAMKGQMTPMWDDLDNRRSRFVNLMARLAPGVSREEAEAALAPLYRRLNEAEVAELPADVGSERYRREFVDKRLAVLPGARGLSEMRRESTAPLAVLLAMVGLVLLIACANVANLLLARGLARQRETALKLALGAGRLRVVRQRLLEGLVYALAGGGLGLLLATWAGELLLRAMATPDGGDPVLSSAPDLRVALFTAAVAMATPLVFALGPALRATRPDLLSALKEDAAGAVGGRAHARFRRGLVAAQVALATVLAAGAGLFAHNLANLRAVDPGFPIARLATFTIDPPKSGYELPQAQALAERLRGEIEALPGVERASLAAVPVLARSMWRSTIEVDGYDHEEDEDMSPVFNAVGPGYFETLGIPVVAGRGVRASDTAQAPRVAVVNRALARYFWGDENPIGRTLRVTRDKEIPIEVVGVVGDSKTLDMRDELWRTVYLPYPQTDGDLGAITYYVQAAGPPETLADPLRQTMARVAPEMPLFDLKTMEVQVGDTLLLDRLVALLATLFGVLATLLAAIGLYGVMSYSVARRTREIGIRMALGAVLPAILWGVLREVGTLAALGFAVGLPLYLVLGRLVESQLYGLSAADPAVLGLVVLLLAATALAAGWWPARRATRIDPLQALRSE